MKTKKEITSGNRFHSYMRGWGDGAGHRAINPAYENHELKEFYDNGYADGQTAFREASTQASMKHGYKPSILRTHDPVGA